MELLKLTERIRPHPVVFFARSKLVGGLETGFPYGQLIRKQGDVPCRELKGERASHFQKIIVSSFFYEFLQGAYVADPAQRASK
jgi:hypothetical protein